jgi:transcriptional regulator with XRE-family HTH domain
MNDTDQKAMGKIILHLRLSMELTQTELGRQLGLYQQSVGRMESGDRKMLATELIQLAEISGYTIDQIVYGVPTNLTAELFRLRRMRDRFEAALGEDY